MALSNAVDLRCPRCRSMDRLRMATSYPEKFPTVPRPEPPSAAAPHPEAGTVAVPPGAIMVVFLLASLPFLAGSLYRRLTEWPAVLSIPGSLLPRPLLCAAVAAILLVIALDRATRELLLRVGREVLLHPRFHVEPEARTTALAVAAVPVGLAGFGWGVFLGLKSLDLWLGMATTWMSGGPAWAPVVVWGFLAGVLAVLAGLPLAAFVMAWTFNGLAEYGVPRSDAGSPADFTRHLVYPCVLLPLTMGVAMSSGIPALFVLATCWFVAAMIVAAHRTLKESGELALPVALLAAVLMSLIFFLVTLQVRTNVVHSDWGTFRGRSSVLPDLELLWLAGALALGGLLGLAPRLPAIWSARKRAGRSPASREAIALRKQMIYCERCDGVHLPNQRQFVPASEAASLLHGSIPTGRL